jgi:membrane protein DedA with SNARE-associated domain
VGASGDEGFGPTKGQMAAGLAVLGGVVGALAGYAIGRSRHKRVLVYEAAQP